MLAVRFTRFDREAEKLPRIANRQPPLCFALHKSGMGRPRGLDAKLCRRIGFLRDLLKENSRAG